MTTHNTLPVPTVAELWSTFLLVIGSLERIQRPISMTALQRILPITMGLIIAGSVAAWAIKKPAPWAGMDECELAQYAFDYFGESSGHATLPEMIAGGLYVAPPVREYELDIFLVRTDQNGAEDAKMHWLQFNPWTGKIRTERIGENPDRIRELGASLRC